MVMHAAIANLTQHGVKVTVWLSVACEFLEDWANGEKATGLLDIYRELLPQWSMLETTHSGWSQEQRRLAAE